MKKRYILAVEHDKDKRWKEDEGLPTTLKQISQQLHAWDNEQSRIKRRGKHEEFSPYRRTVDTITRLTATLPRAKVGDFFTIENQPGRSIFLRVVDVSPNIIGTEGTPAIDKIYTMTMAKYHDRVSSWGICSCRDIGSTSTISQHAYCNAWDLHASPQLMEEIFRWYVRDAEGENSMHIHTTIYNHRVWSRENPTIHPYITPPGGSDHEDHVHVDPDPQSPGRPCAS